MNLSISVILRRTRKGIIVLIPGFDTAVLTSCSDTRQALSEALESISSTLSKEPMLTYRPNLLSIPLRQRDMIDILKFRPDIISEKPNLTHVRTGLYSVRKSIRSGIYNTDIFRPHK